MLSAIGLPVGVAIGAGLLLIGIVVYGIIYRREEFAKEWLPSVITGLFVAGILPLANDVYWKRQKQFETCVQDRDKRYELLASTARTYTALFKVHTRLHDNNQQRKTELRSRGSTLRTERILRLENERLELLKERMRLEGEIGADSALVDRYLPGVITPYFDLAREYDIRTTQTLYPTPTEPLVQQAHKLIADMAQEARRLECD